MTVARRQHHVWRSYLEAWAADGKIFCLDDAGTTYVLDAGPEFKLLATNNLNEMFWASPAVADGSILLRSVDSLYCIRTKDDKK